MKHEPITILDLALYRGARETDGRIDAGEIERVGLPFFGGCYVCHASIACYNAAPTTTGYLACADECADGRGFATVEEANEFIFGESEITLPHVDVEAWAARDKETSQMTPIRPSEVDAVGEWRYAEPDEDPSIPQHYLGIILPNVRFNFWLHRGWWGGGNEVKITLHPGQTINHYSRRPSDEGWESVHTLLTYDLDGFLHVTIHKEGTDCDGRMSRTVSAEANITDCTEDGKPIWCEPSYSQRDYTAEAANY